jgi:hypothetical protein
MRSRPHYDRVQSMFQAACRLSLGRAFSDAFTETIRLGALPEITVHPRISRTLSILCTNAASA